MSNPDHGSDASRPPPHSTIQNGLRKNGKGWHNLAPRKAFRPTGGQTAYSKRLALRQATAATKAIEREMKDEKDAQRSRLIDGIKEKRKRREDRERFEKMEVKMHRKRIERLKRREKRNKMLGK